MVVVVVVDGRASVGRGCGGGDGRQLQLDEHHVIAQAHRQIQRSFARKEIVHLAVVKALQRLHDALLGTLRQQTGFDTWQQRQAATVTDAVVPQCTLPQMPVFPEEAYPFFGHFQAFGDGLFERVYTLRFADFDLELATGSGRHRDADVRFT